MTTRERLVAIIDESGGMLRHCDERTSKALKSFYNALFMLADSIDGKTEEIRGNQEKISPNFKIEKGKMYRCIHSIDTFEKDHIYQSYEDGWIKNDDDNHVIAYSKYFCPVSEEKPESAFEAAIQPGNKIVFNEDMDCCVNLSQLNRVAKKEPRQENSPVLSNSPNIGKVEQKPNNDLPKGEDYGIDSLWHAERILEKTLGEVEGYQSDDGILEHKCAISSIKELKKMKQPNWSEDDEKMLDEIIDFFENGTVKLQHDLSLYASWLKSLRPQPQWKPSDAQMESIRQAVSNMKNSACYDSELVHFLHDLEKLRGE